MMISSSEIKRLVVRAVFMSFSFSPIYLGNFIKTPGSAPEYFTLLLFHFSTLR